jgi:hypothetical protein
MNWGLITTGFIFGTFKFLFAHWTIYFTFDLDGLDSIVEIFISISAGAIATMAVFYFFSDYMMDRAALKRKNKRLDAIKNGIEFIPKKKFTRMNKALVRVKMKLGIYGVTLLAPLFLSIPLGSVVCAKFYGHHKKTFPLMLLFTTSYSFLMCTLIYLVL